MKYQLKIPYLPSNFLYQPLTKPHLSTTLKEHNSYKRLNKIQGLRGVAIIGVLLFHLWPRIFTNGFLGVDIFFVISGYLMIMLLDKKPLNFQATKDFYFKRLKRILPTYLFVIFIVLLTALFLISPTDFSDLYRETIKPIVITANIPDNIENDYFAKSQGKYQFFMHMWSLSVELQFYLLVPCIFYFLHQIPAFLQLFSISFLLIISCIIQLNLTNNYEHMSLVGRIWQFMLGFLAFHFSSNQKNKELINESIFIAKMNKIINFSITFLLAISTLIELTPYKQMNRIIISILSFIIISRPDQSPLLNNFMLIFLGDISYSVYLIHWPLFEWYRYTNVRVFEFEGGTTFSGGIFLLVAFVILGQLIEEIFKQLNKYIKSWISLVGVIFTLYLAIFAVMHMLSSNSIDIKFNKRNIHLSNPELILKKAVHYYDNFESLEKIDKMDSIKWTINFAKAATAHPWYCDSLEVPTNFKNKTALGRLASACVVRRESVQNKTIVVVGNSHARMLFPGILHHFDGLFTEATLMTRNGCQYVGTFPDDYEVRMCSKERTSVIPMLKEWKRPIDIIIFAMAYTPKIDPVLDPNINIKDDQIFIEMQKFYANLAKITREVLFVPILQFSNGLRTYMSVLQRKIVLNQSLEVFRTSLQYALTHRLNTRRRTEQVQCYKCLKYDLADMWCSRSEKVCDSIDQERKIGFFVDSHHMNLFGSLFAGKFLRTKYDQWMISGNITISS